MKYKSEHLESISEDLKKLPKVNNKKQEYNTKESIFVLKKEILSLKKRGYTLDQISEILCREGLSISASTLKNYLSSGSCRLRLI